MSQPPSGPEVAGPEAAGPDDVFDERSNRRLVLVVRALLVCAALSLPTPSPGLAHDPAIAALAARIMIGLGTICVVYVTVLTLAGAGRWGLARALLFSAWSVSPGLLVTVYDPRTDALAQLLVLLPACLFAAVVPVAMLALAPWRHARGWVALALASTACGLGSLLLMWPEARTAGFLTLSGVVLALIAAPVLPLWAILTDLDDALGQSRRARIDAADARDRAARARDQALAASSAKSSFLANMSHELRTPLNAILGYVELVLEEACDRGLWMFDEDLGRVRGAAQHLLGLIDAVLDLSKIEAGSVTVRPEWFCLNALLDDVVGTIQPLARARGLRLRTDYGSLGHMHSDARRITQVLLNLLSNAVKYTEAGFVEVEATADSGTLTVQVRDSGVGIAPAHLTEVFEPFERTDAEVTRRTGGTGLGLAISKRVCEILGGELSATSVVGTGSTFVVRLPIRAVATDEAP